MAKDKTYIRLIHTSRWLRLRHEVLSAHPLCERCREEGRLAAACEVHHIRPVEEAVTDREKERLMFAISNLRALCHDCHVKTHTEMGRSGRKATRQRNERQLSDLKKRFLGGQDEDEGEGK